ncbi:hypothetical protein RFI_16147, partial [Reticulomyxa filosa]
KQRSGTFGLSLLFRMMPLITHWNRLHPDTSPIIALQIDAFLDKMRLQVLGDATDPQYFEKLIRKYLLNDKINNRVCLVMRTDEEYLVKKETKEQLELEHVAVQLTDTQMQDIDLQTKQLNAYQSIEPNVNVLPTLQRTDIPILAPDPLHVHSDKQHRCTFLSTDTITNDLVYFRLLYDLSSSTIPNTFDCTSHSPSHLVPLLMPMYALCLTGMGASDKTPEQLSQ